MNMFPRPRPSYDLLIISSPTIITELPPPSRLAASRRPSAIATALCSCTVRACFVRHSSVSNNEHNRSIWCLPKEGTWIFAKDRAEMFLIVVAIRAIPEQHIRCTNIPFYVCWYIRFKVYPAIFIPSIYEVVSKPVPHAFRFRVLRVEKCPVHTQPGYFIQSWIAEYSADVFTLARDAWRVLQTKLRR